MNSPAFLVIIGLVTATIFAVCAMYLISRSREKHSEYRPRHK